RTGGRAGMKVSEDIEDQADPAKFLILTNNDFEQHLPDGRRDFEDNVGAIANGDYQRDQRGLIIDDDLSRITLRQLPTSATQGTFSIELSDSSSVRLFKSDGSPLASLTLSLSSPSGYLSDLRYQELDVWLEGLHEDADFTFSVVCRDGGGQEICRDDVHMTIADWTFFGKDGDEVQEVLSFPKVPLLDRANGETSLTALPDNVYYKIRLDGVPTSAIGRVRVTSDKNASDFYDDTLVAMAGATESQDFGVMYSSNNSGDILTSGERDSIRQNLQLNAVHNDGATTQLTTGPATNPIDLQVRRLAKQKLAPNWGRGIGAMQYNYHSMNLRFPVGTNAENLAAAIYNDLKNFNRFGQRQGGTNIAEATFTKDQPYDRAHFELNQNGLLFLGIADLNHWANVLASIDVLLVPKDSQKRLFAVTLGRHPLVGVRSWRVWTAVDPNTNEVIATIMTEAWDRVSARTGAFPGLNAFGMMWGGGQNQNNMWSNYFDNLTERWLFDPPAALPHATQRGRFWTHTLWFPDGQGSTDMSDDMLNPLRWQLPVELQANDPTL
ncbi:MAG: hypothetical protein ACREJC_17040, partial [Tepidisphaeraceae bacterium]